MDVLFMGTPEFAVPTVEALLGSRHVLKAVVTQPDKPAGRGRKLTTPPVKRLAQSRGVPCLQPARLKDPAVLEEIAAFSPEVIVVAAYGKILPPAVLELPTKGCINVHASLLPNYRGAAPINWALIKGESETGITIMLMDEEMDHGPILLKRAVAIEPGETAGELHDRLALLGAECLMEALEEVEVGAITPTPQDHTQATYAPMLSKDDGWLDWKEPAEALLNRIRGVTPWPGATTVLEGEAFKVWKAQPGPSGVSGKPGEVTHVGEEGITVACGRGSLLLKEVQLAGKKRLDAESFLRGRSLKPGAVLGGRR